MSPSWYWVALDQGERVNRSYTTMRAWAISMRSLGSEAEHIALRLIKGLAAWRHMFNAAAPGRCYDIRMAPAANDPYLTEA